MKLRLIASLLTFLSAYSPLALIVVIKDLDSNTFIPQHMPVALTILFVSFMSCVIVRKAAQKIEGGLPVRITKVSNKSGDMFAYTIPYMISFYNFNLGDWKTLLCLGIFMSLMFALSHRTQNVFINPVLALAGYGLYDCQFKDAGKERQGFLISKNDFQIGDTCQIEQLSKFLYFVSHVQTSGENSGE